MTGSVDPAPQRTVLGIGGSPYYDFTLARALTLLGARDVDGVNWFVAGASRAIAGQRADGSWFVADAADATEAATPDVLETAWRLGLLARVTLPEVALGDREEID